MKITRKIFALALSLCLLTACAPAEESSAQRQTTTSQSTTASEATASSAEKTTPAETAPEPAEPTAEPVSEPDKPAEEEIVPLEIFPQSLPRVNIPISELAAILTLIYSETDTLYIYEYIRLWFSDVSTLDSPLPNSTYIQDWGCYPKVIVSAIESNQPSEFTQPSEIVIATDLTGISPDDLYKLIDDGTPVMVWITEWLFGGETLSEVEGIAINSHHECAILVGYSDTSVMVWSPFQDDYVTYDRAKFEECFEKLGSFALTITKKE